MLIKYIPSYQIQQLHTTSRVFWDQNNLTYSTHLFPHPKIGPGPKNDEKWVFIIFGLAMYHWKNHVKEILKSIWSAPPEYKSWALKWSKLGSSLSKVMPYSVGKSMERFQKVKIFSFLQRPTLPKNQTWAQKQAKLSVHKVIFCHIPLESPWKGDF